MIAVTDLHGCPLYVNAELVERIEATPDTMVTLTTGQRIYVAESPDDVVTRIMEYRRYCLGSTAESSGPPCRTTLRLLNSDNVGEESGS